jgi:hypothetical protein
LMKSSGRFSIATGIGSRTSIRRGKVFSRYRRTTCSKRLTSIVVGALVPQAHWRRQEVLQEEHRGDGAQWGYTGGDHPNRGYSHSQ